MSTGKTAAEYCNGEAFQPCNHTQAKSTLQNKATVLSTNVYTCTGDVAEYCIGEDFQPRCTGNDVIVILGGRYGRMKVGRCVEVEPGFESMLEDPRYLGCSADVLAVVSRQCSGRSQCQLRVSDQTFDNVNSCYTSLKMYLEVTYMCISGEFISYSLRPVSAFFLVIYMTQDATFQWC